MPERPLNERLGTDVLSVMYEFADKIGQLHMPPNCCCDMTACIDLFHRIDPKVIRIETYAGEKPDTVYRIKRGQWIAELSR